MQLISRRPLGGRTPSASHLNVMVGKLLGQGETAVRSGIYSIVDGNLAVLVVQPSVDVFPALLENFLAEQDRSWRRIRKKVILRDMASLNRGPAVVTQMEDPGLDAKPTTNQCHRARDWGRIVPTTTDSEPSRHRCDCESVSLQPGL